MNASCAIEQMICFLCFQLFCRGSEFFGYEVFLNPEAYPAKFGFLGTEFSDGRAVDSLVHLSVLVDQNHVDKFAGFAHFQATHEPPANTTWQLLFVCRFGRGRCL